MSKTPMDPLHVWESGGAVLGMNARIPTPGADLGRGLTPGAPTDLQSLVRSGFETAFFLHAELLITEQMGLELGVLASNPRVLRIRSVCGTPLRALRADVMAAVHIDSDVQFDPQDPGTVFLELGDELRSVVRADERQGVLIDAAARSISQLWLPLEVEACEPIVSPSAQWCSEYNDRWLALRVEQILETGDGWQHARAVGVLKRLGVVSADASALMRQMCGGIVVEALARPHVWFRSLSAAQQRTVERLGCQAAAELEALMRARSDAAGIERCAVDRDGLEGVRLLLGEAGRGDRLDAALTKVDRLGMAWERERVRAAITESEQLQRARAMDPGAWWAGGNW